MTGLGVRRSPFTRLDTQVPPRCRVVERTFGWLTGGHRLVRDDKARMDLFDAMIPLDIGSPLPGRVAQSDL